MSSSPPSPTPPLAPPLAGKARRILSLWLPRAAAEHALRRKRLASLSAPLAAAPFAILAEQRGALRVASLSAAAERCGVNLGQSAADARAVAPDLVTMMADPSTRAALSVALQRWALRYCPWVSEDRSDETPPFGSRAQISAPSTAKTAPKSATKAADKAPESWFRGDLSLVLDITGSAHLFGGEAALVEQLTSDLQRLGFTAQAAVAESRGAAWALARCGRHAEGSPPLIAPPGGARAALASLPPAALRLEPKALEGLARLGVASIETLAGLPRGAVSRRFGPGTLRRLDQAFGSEPEPVAPRPPPAPYAVRLSLPEPIGLLADLEAGLDRLLQRLCDRLQSEGMGARRLVLDLRRVDRAVLRLETALARPGRDPAAIARLFERSLQKVEAGFGIDGLRLEAIWVERLAERQTAIGSGAEGALASNRRLEEDDAMAGLLTALGGRLGFDRLTRLAPAESHLPDRAALSLAAAYASPNPDWTTAAAARPPRPLSAFPPEPIRPLKNETPEHGSPPACFTWRGARHEVRTALGPERIAPEWWRDDPAWRDGVRDYWRVETIEGLRLWLFQTPEASRPEGAASPPSPRWFVAGVFA